MKNRIVIVVMLAAVYAAAEGSVDEDLRLFLEYYEGQFNNGAQVEAEQELAEELRHPWHHSTVQRVRAPAFGEYVFFAQINEEGPDGEIVRQRVNVFDVDPETGAIRQTFYAIDPGREGVDFPVGAADLEGIGPEDLRGYPDSCRVMWRRDDERFLGTIDKGDCAVVSRRSGQNLVAKTTRLSFMR